MARQFVAASVQSLSVVVAPPSVALPLTMACWYTQEATLGNGELMGYYNSLSSSNRFGLSVRAAGTLRASHADTATAGNANTTSTTTAGVWTHACGVFISTTSRTVYMNGGNSVNNTSNIALTMAGLDNIKIGQFGNLGAGGNLQGKVAHACVWSAQLTAGEIAALAAGVHPRLIRPDAIINYWPLYGDSPEPNQAAGGATYQLTVNNSPTIVPEYGVSPHVL